MEKCYGELGCFSTGGAFGDMMVRPVQLLPRSRADIDVKFEVFDRSQSIVGRSLEAGDNRLLKLSKIDTTKPLIFIVHGFLEYARVAWVYVSLGKACGDFGKYLLGEDSL